MSTLTANRIVLARHPQGAPVDDDFRLETVSLPPPGPGELRMRILYLSLDPYMRGRMNPGPSYAPGVAIGAQMVGRTVAQVIDSQHPDFPPGCFVQGYQGWCTHALSDGAGLRRLDPAAAPLSTAIGILGSPGFTAWWGMMTIGRPRAGETVAVSAASGAVGAVAAQLARLEGARVVGIAGGAEKCRYLTQALGLDAAVDHRAADLAGRLAAACPAGIDVYFENVGGPVFAAVLPLLNDFARVPVCGAIAHYNEAAQPGPDLGALWGRMVVKRLHIQGFIVRDHYDRMPEYIETTAPLVREGRLKYREDIVDGLENAPAAFRGLLEGRNFGKLMIRVSPDPTRG